MDLSRVVPRNREQAYGLRILSALNIVEQAMQLSALFKSKPLDGSTAETLASAVNVLQEFFPQLPSVNAYQSAERVYQELNFLYRTLARNEDSPMRQHWQGLLRARLYSSSLRSRVRDMAADPALNAIATQDNFPLSLVLGEGRFVNTPVSNNRALISLGIDVLTPGDIIEAGSRPFSEAERVFINRDGMMSKIKRLLDAFGVVVERAPFARTLNKGGAVIEAITAVNAEEFGQDADTVVTPAGLADYASSLKYVDPNWVVLANGDTGSGVSNDGAARGWARCLGNATVFPRFGITVNTQAGAEVHGTILIQDSVNYTRELTLASVVNGVSAPLAVPRTGSSSGSLVWGSLTFDYAEYVVSANQSRMVFTIRNLPAGTVGFGVGFTATIGAGQLVALAVSFADPMTSANVVAMDDFQRIEYIKDNGFDDMMEEYFIIRQELDNEGVTEAWWLKSYAPYIVSDSNAYQNFTALTTAQINRLKGPMLLPEIWPEFYDLTGFLRKMHDDLGTLLCLAQSSDFE